jgi:hypothetical protein
MRLINLCLVPECYVHTEDAIALLSLSAEEN